MLFPRIARTDTNSRVAWPTQSTIVIHLPRHARHHLVTALPMAQVRAPTQPPSPPQHRQLQILFRHPGYDDGNNVLFKLQAPDTDGDGQPGLFAQFAIDACAIIAGNRAGRGWLSLSRDGSAPIDPTSTLRKRSYYFHLDAADAVDDPYAIVPNFRQWSYPHDHLPLHWQQLASHSNSSSSGITLAPSNLTTALLMRDGSCRLSGCREQLQVAHVVPQSELDWWRANDMSRYNTGSSATLDDTANALLLRADLHIAFDKPRVAFVPKPVIDGSMRLVAHLLDHSPELEQFLPQPRVTSYRSRRGHAIRALRMVYLHAARCIPGV
jgi:hypothetical protein